ncbi:MAG: hypothetical protein MUE51_06585 [Thermoleophilia bacterium]|jgi:ribosomal protein S27AE|nr:hypothetical protein [Thermoleophilia bacterium]
MSETAAEPAQAPECPRCGAGTFATTRTIRTHDITSGRAVPKEQAHPVWRCFRCGAETPRQA